MKDHWRLILVTEEDLTSDIQDNRDNYAHKGVGTEQNWRDHIEGCSRVQREGRRGEEITDGAGISNLAMVIDGAPRSALGLWHAFPAAWQALSGSYSVLQSICCCG